MVKESIVMRWKAIGCSKPEFVEVNGAYAANFYFETEAEAWDRLRADAKAGVTLAAREVERCRTSLREAERNAADACVEYRAVMENYSAWKSR